MQLTLSIERRQSTAAQTSGQWAWGLTILLALPPVLLMTVPGWREAAEAYCRNGFSWQLFGLTILKVVPTVEPTGADVLVQEGEVIAGYVITSGYGWRESPCPGCSSDHRGVDVATPLGTPLYAPTQPDQQVTVECWWDGGGGGQVADITTPEGKTFQALHLQRCTSGTYQGGEVFARTGDTGNGTGPHLDWRDRTADGGHQPPTRRYLAWVLTGQIPHMSASSELSDEELWCAIGNAEGVVNPDCTPNQNYWGHGDSGFLNLGAFSYIHGAASPEEADAKQLERLRAIEPEFDRQAQEKWGQPLSKAAKLAALDLQNQSPKAAQDFIHHLPTYDPTPQQIINARATAFVNPITGKLEAPGLDNDWGRVKRDQKRRLDNLLNFAR
ncbi:M23 family metallopeptidase [Halomicronema sp. CCY15110]|uniref:M23 family metallopeptidase n=1 Tax=Halomicronema sp. CCY15110 TaxID=2767773 RepID=UPI00194E6D8F|nr:M23 family metallopeptidase [Halomicronema sp. CCY15110]